MDGAVNDSAQTVRDLEVSSHYVLLTRCPGTDGVDAVQHSNSLTVTNGPLRPCCIALYARRHRGATNLTKSVGAAHEVPGTPLDQYLSLSRRAHRRRRIGDRRSAPGAKMLRRGRSIWWHAPCPDDPQEPPRGHAAGNHSHRSCWGDRLPAQGRRLPLVQGDGGTSGRCAAAYPDIVRVFSIGKSYEGRELWAAEVSDNAGPGRGRAGGPLRRPAPRPRAPERGDGHRRPRPARRPVRQVRASASGSPGSSTSGAPGSSSWSTPTASSTT